MVDNNESPEVKVTLTKVEPEITLNRLEVLILSEVVTDYFGGLMDTLSKLSEPQGKGKKFQFFCDKLSKEAQDLEADLVRVPDKLTMSGFNKLYLTQNMCHIVKNSVEPNSVEYQVCNLLESTIKKLIGMEVVKDAR